MEKIHTKSNPKINLNNLQLKIKLPSKSFLPKTQYLSIEEMEQFKKIRKIKDSGERNYYEKDVKNKFKKIINEKRKFSDWGGEKNDLFSTMARINKKRTPIALAFKGKGTRGILVPKKMGKNGDQIQRLFQSPAEVFFIQYIGQIDQSVLEQMEAFAQITSLYKNKKIYYGLINGEDTNKIMQL